MSAAQGFGIGLGIVALIFGASAVANHLEEEAIRAAVPKPTTAWSKIAFDADHNLYWDLRRIAADPRVPAHLRQLAEKGARLVHQHWLAPGHAGYGIEPTQSTVTMYNWCGANYGSGPCINIIDCACRDHDIARRMAFG